MMKSSTAGRKACDSIEQAIQSEQIPLDLPPVEVKSIELLPVELKPVEQKPVELMLEELKPIELKPCPNCGRTFNPTTLEKHVTICKKTSQKRDVFNSFLQRSTGVNAAVSILRTPDPPKTKKYGDGPQLAKSNKKETAVVPKPKQESKNPKQNPLTTTPVTIWATPSPETPRPSTSTRASTSAATSNAAKREPKTENRPRASYLDTARLQPCPHCGRKFNEKAWEGHVEWCKNRCVHGNFNVFFTNATTPMARERVQARIHYQPPFPKPKRK